MKLKHYIATLSIVAVLFCALLIQGCVKEDLSDCGIAVRFEFIKNVDNINKFHTSVSDIVLHILTDRVRS